MPMSPLLAIAITPAAIDAIIAIFTLIIFLSFRRH
jgi:hypothetical protein